MVESNTNLDYWLGRLYEHHVVKNHTDSDVMDLFKKRMEASQSLKEAAKTRSGELVDDVLKKCFISRKYKEFLTTALGE